MRLAAAWSTALAKGCAVCPGKPARLGEAVKAGKLGNISLIGIGIARRSANCLQPAQQDISGGADTQKLDAIRPQGPVADANPLAQLWHAGHPAEMLRQYLFEPDHDQGLMTFGGTFLVDLGPDQADDQRVDQVVFDRSCDLGMRQDFRLGLGQAAGLRVQAPQARRIAFRGPQHSPFPRRTEGLFEQSPAVIVKPHRIECDQAPDEGAGRGLVQPLAEAVKHDIPGLQFGAAPPW